MIGLIGAMAEEIELLRQMEDGVTTQIAGTEFTRGTIAGKEVVLAFSGIGKVNAAICAQVMVSVFGVDKVIFTGVAGGIAAELAIGDIVVSGDTAYYDMDVTALGYELGMIPRQRLRFFAGDPALIAACRQAEATLPVKVLVGRVLTGDSFIADPERARKLRDTLDGHCIDMEGAAVAQVCTLNRVPFVIIRSLSDRADQKADIDYKASVRLAAANAANLARRVVEAI